MSEMQIIMDEKNKKIESLEVELKTTKADFKAKSELAARKTSGMITKESAARDVYSRLKAMRFVGWIALGAPIVCGLLGSVNYLAGGVLGLACSVAAVFVYKREIMSEMQRLNDKYGIVPK